MYPYKALQNPAEMKWFTNLIKKEGVKSYLEIGSKFGGSLWLVAQVLPCGSRIVSVDLPIGPSQTQLQDCVDRISQLGHESHVIYGDSTRPDIIERVQKLGPYDAVFIDANHTLPYVIKDWENYGPMCRLVAFHDINFWRSEPMPPGKLPIDVPQVWQRLSKAYRHEEIRLDHQDNGIGVLWRQ